MIGIVAKTFWDKLVERREELAKLRRDKKLEILERQLSEFYWPLYLRLEKDNLIWQQVFTRDNQLSPDVRERLEAHFILPNHEEILEILESKIHLARASEDLSKQIFQYIRHIAIYQAIRGAGISDKDPMDFNEPFPQDLYRLVNEKKDALQAEYDKLLDLERDRSKKRYKFHV
jgi:AAA+ superfamily predicted ATPase